MTYNIYTATAEKLPRVKVFFFSLKAGPNIHSFKPSVKRPHERRIKTKAN